MKINANNFCNPNIKGSKEGINIYTYHKSKGLEFKIVILYNFHNWYKFSDNPDELLNLKFVGITRAEKELHMYYTKYDLIPKKNGDMWNKLVNECNIIKTIPRALYDIEYI